LFYYLFYNGNWNDNNIGRCGGLAFLCFGFGGRLLFMLDFFCLGGRRLALDWSLGFTLSRSLANRRLLFDRGFSSRFLLGFLNWGLNLYLYWLDSDKLFNLYSWFLFHLLRR
jgi:hypothetical protein